MEDFVRQNEREMLLRYCHRFTHDWSLAEDLTQQALLECWLKSNQLCCQEVRSSWLIGIARNICLRWLRSRKQEQSHIAIVSDLPTEIETAFEDDVDLVEELERHELAQLVEKALALLPPQTRTVLVQYYLKDIPQAERYGFGGQCPACGWQDYCSPAGLLQSLPEVQRFWQRHPRMRMIFHEQLYEAVGQKASVASFESIIDAAHIDIVFARDTLKLIDIHTNVL